MKNKKIMLVFIAMIILFMAVAPIVNATNSNPLQVFNEEDDNNVPNATNEGQNGTLDGNNDASNTNNENTNAAENNLPQTGVAEDTTLFIFIGICLVSAIYAYTKIRNYRNI